MDTEVKSLSEIKAMEGRDLDSAVNADTLISGEKADGTFGVFKFFTGIKSFFKGISALGTLASGSKVLVTDDNGNISYTTPSQIKSGMNLVDTTALNGALSDYGFQNKKTTSYSGDLNDAPQGFFSCGGNVGHAPNNYYGFVHTLYFANNTKFASQYWYSMQKDLIFYRLKDNDTWGDWKKIIVENDLNGALSNYPFIVNATLSENKTINANSYVDITINYSDVGFTPTKVIVQLSNRISKLAVASVSSVGITSTSCNIRLFNHESVVYNLDASNAKFFVLVQK